MASLLRARKVSGAAPDTDLSKVPPLDCHDSRMISVGMFTDTPGAQATLVILWTDGTANMILGTLVTNLTAVNGLTFKNSAMCPMSDNGNNVPCVPCCGAFAYIGVIAIDPPAASVTIGAMVV